MSLSRTTLALIPLVGAAFFIESLLPPGEVAGQFNNALFAQRDDSDEHGSSIFVPAPLELRRHLTVAKRSLEEQRYSEAVIQLGELLAGGENDSEVAQDYFVGRIGQPGTQLSLKEEALRLIGSMPSRGRDLYELQFGAEARALLDEGVKSGDVEKLTQVARRYFHTKAGYEATYLLGRYELDLDRPLAAALSFQRLVDTPDARRFEPELSVLLAMGWSRAGMPEKASETLAGLKQRMPQATISVAGERKTLFGDSQDALAWLDTISGSQIQVPAGSAAQWVMYRGDASRTARSDGGFPLLSARWRLPTANDPADERTVQQINRDYLDRGVPALPALQPLVVSDFVLMRTPRRLIGVDFRSGKRVWEWPHSNDLSRQGSEPRSTAGATVGPSRRNELNQRVWEDAPYGQMSSDGQSVFFVDALGSAGPDSRSVNVMPFGGFRRNMNFAKTTNTLVSLDLRRQGYLKWRVGDESGLDEPKLADAFFLGAPLALMNQVYALVEINGELRLVVLDSETGRLQWSQQLAYVDTRTIMADPIRRLAGASPSFADGVLICPTSAGAVVALNVATRSLRWGFTYQTNVPVVNQFGFQPTNQKVPEYGERWMDSTATIAKGRVILTPVESDQLYCLDLLSGESVWEPKKRGDLLYVACVHEGKIVLVGKREVTAIRLSDGSAAWNDVVRLPDDDMPSGRGFHSDRHYYLPTTGSRLLKIDLDGGQIAESIPTDSVLGNLVCYGDEVVSQGPQFVQTYYQAEALRDRVAGRLAENPDDVWALTRQGELLLQSGQQTEALASLRRAHQVDAADLSLHRDEIDSLLIRTMLAALKQDFSANREIAAELVDLVRQPNEVAEYLRLMAEGYKSTGQLEKSFEAFLKLVDLDLSADVDLDSTGEEFERNERFVTSRRDRWVQANLVELFESADEPVRAEMTDQLSQRLKRVLASEGAAELRQFVQYFGGLPLAEEASFALAERLADAGSFLEAELLLARARQSSDESAAARATVQTAALLVKAERLADAAGYYHQLLQRWPEVKLADGRRAADHAAEALQRPELQTAAPHREWPDGRVRVEETTNASTRYTGNRFYAVRMEQADGLGVENMEVVIDHQRNLFLRDSSGEQVSQISLSANTRHYGLNVTRGRANGHLLVVSMGYEVFAIDVLRAMTEPNYALLWRKDLMESVVSNPRAVPSIRTSTISTPWGTTRVVAADGQNNPIGTIGPVTSTGVYFQRFRELVCVDPLSGEKIWSRNNVEPGSHIFGDEERIFVIPPKGLGLVLSAIDGRTLKEPPLSGEETWATNGSRVLSWQQVRNEDGESTDDLHLRLYDMAAERELWKYVFPLGSKGDLIGSDEVAIVEPAGRLRILSLSDGRTIVDQPIEPESSLESIAVKRFNDQYIVGLRCTRSYDARLTVNVLGQSSDVPMINGRVYAFDRETGKPQWQTPATIEQFSMPLDQPNDSPLLLFGRTIRTNPQSGNRNNYISILALDRRDGRILVSNDEIPGNIASYEMRVDRRQKKVTVNLQVRTYTFTFTDEPTPPAPPATAGDLSHLLAEGPIEQFRQRTRAVINGVRALPGVRRVPLPAAE